MKKKIEVYSSYRFLTNIGMMIYRKSYVSAVILCIVFNFIALHATLGQDISMNSRVILFEDSTSPISSISHISLSNNGQYVLASDNKSGRSFIYELTTGKLVRTLSAQADFSDSLKANGYWPDPMYRYTQFLDSTMKLWSTKNTIDVSVFLTDSTVFSNATVYSALCKVDSIVGEDEYYSDPSIAQHAVGIIYSSDGVREVNPLEWRTGGYAPQSNVLCYNPESKSILSNIINSSIANRGKYDSTFCLAEYTIEGKLIRLLPFPLPEECIKYRLGYSLMTPVVACDSIGSIYSGFSSVPRIYNVTKKTSFNLVNVGSNSMFFSSLSDYFTTHNRPHRVPWDSLFLKKEFTLHHISMYDSQKIVVISLYKTNQSVGYNFRAQLYSTDGRLIKEQTFSNTGPSKYEFMTYSHNLKKIVAIGINNNTYYFCDTISF